MKIYKIIASGLGSGYVPIAPGTAGSMLGITILYMFNYILYICNIGNWAAISANFVAIVLFLFVGVYSIGKVHSIWQHDASKIVIDEIVGVWIAVFAMPLNWLYYLYALILFRFFDIYKPLFIRKLDNMRGDWSVMLDDVLAGVYSLIILQLLLNFSLI